MSNVVALPRRGPRLVNKKQLADLLSVSTRTIENYTRDGMPSVAINRVGKRMFEVGAVEAWLADRSAPKPAKPVGLTPRIEALESQVAQIARQLGLTA
jgi:phage terminase Nu1 subunit (DNA packaging protein)